MKNMVNMDSPRITPVVTSWTGKPGKGSTTRITSNPQDLKRQNTVTRMYPEL